LEPVSECSDVVHVIYLLEHHQRTMEVYQDKNATAIGTYKRRISHLRKSAIIDVQKPDVLHPSP